MTRTHEKVRYTPKGERYTALTAAQGVEDALKVLGGALETHHPLSPLRREGAALLGPRTGDSRNFTKDADSATSTNGS